MTQVVVEPDESIYEQPSARRKRTALAARTKAKRRERTSD